MSYLGIALFAEGPTDHRFLAPLIQRLVIDLVADRGGELPDVGDVLTLTSPEGSLGEPREARIAAAAHAARFAFHVLCVHADGGGDPPRVRAQQVDPGLSAALRVLAPESYGRVAIIPVREMEAWTLVDGEALRRAFRTTLSDDEMGLPRRARDVENLLDPKSVLTGAHRASLQGARRRSDASPTGALPLIAERIRLDVLRQVPSFAAFQGEMEAALRSLHFIG